MMKKIENISEYEEIYDQFNDILFIHNGDGRITFANAAAFRQLGYTLKDVQELKFSDLLPSPFLEEAQARTVKQHRGEPVEQPWNARIRTKDGKEIWYQLHTRPVYDSEGNLQKVYGVARNIQTQKETEDRLHYYMRELERLVEIRTQSVEASRQRFQELAELLPDSVFEVDTEGNLMFVNQWAHEQFGYTKEDFLSGLNMMQMIVPEDREAVKARMGQLLGGTTQGLNEYTCIRKDGSTFPAIIHSNPMHRQGKITGIRGFIIDITDRKEWEKHLKNSERMEALGRLSGVVSHDFNNLLMGILGHVTMAMEMVEAEDPLREHLNHIKAYVNTASELTARLMGIARGGQLKLEELNLNSKIEKEASLFSGHISGIAVALNLKPDLPPVSADPVQIEQVLLNLFMNARQAMFRDTGEIIVTTDLGYLTRRQGSQLGLEPGDYVVLTVADNGRGMEPEILDRIFEPFFTTKKGGRGSGLGLSSVYGIIKNHNGHIEVRSSLGSGSVFTIYLPSAAGITPPEDSPRT
ncbi:MAG: PAS domain S-box protein [Spirochaetia bacterium]